MRCIFNGLSICNLQEFGNGLVVPFVVMTCSKECNPFAFVMYGLICEIVAGLHFWQQSPQLAPLFQVQA